MYIYSYGDDDGSVYRHRLQHHYPSNSTKFTDLSLLSHFEIAQRITGDEVHVLVDMQGHTFGGRQEVLAYRPASIQVNFLVYAGSSGAQYIDYLVGIFVYIYIFIYK